MDPTALEKKCSDTIHSTHGWPIRGSVPSCSTKTTNEAVDLRQAYVDAKPLGLLEPYHQHAIGTFNTCSRGPTHQFLTDTGGGYSLGSADFSHTTPRLFQPVVSPFHLRASLGLQFIQNLSTKQEFEFKGAYDRHMVFWPLGHLP
jgi:hypothetical protein